jgi:chorismate synthase
MGNGSSFGKLFQINTFGESHGGAVGVVVDGAPSGIPLSEEDIQFELDRRRPGQSALTTPRKEEDKIKILSGVFEGVTTGTPILMLAHNRDVKSEDYDEIRHFLRPSHADFTYLKKYGRRDWRGSGRASARETLARVAGGAIAKKILSRRNISTLAYVESIGSIVANIKSSEVTLPAVEGSLVRCPDIEASKAMVKLVEEVKESGDSIGGIIRGLIYNVPPGLGEPVFDKLHADLGKAMLSINAVKGFDIGSGFLASHLRGSENNDLFTIKDDKISFVTNHAGGVLGGISTGEIIEFRVAFKPVATISKNQLTVDLRDKSLGELSGTGRHDPCVLPRAVPIVEGMAALVILDHLLRYEATKDL